MTPSSSPRHPPGLAVSSLVLAAALVASAPQAFAATTLIQPGESASKDVLLYEFAIGGFFGIPTPPVSTNLDTDTLNAISPPPVPFGNFLGTSQTEPFSLSPGGDLREHGTKSLLQFDLSGVALGADRVRSATISLFALAGLPPFDNPSLAFPVTTDLRAITEAWGETTATWADAPAVASAVAASAVQTGVGRWVSFDVTHLVKLWLDDPAMNFGVELSQRDIVGVPQASGRDRFVASLYASSAFADPALRPMLAVAPVPVPAGFGLLALATAALGALRLRRRPAA